MLDVPCTERHLDGPANRCLAAMVKNVQQGIRRVRSEISEIVAKERESATRSSLQSRWPRRLAFLNSLELDLSQILRRIPFNEVTSSEITSAGLTAVAAHPLYSRAFKFGWGALRRGLSGQTSSARFWLAPTWEVYERWCFATVAKGVRKLLPALVWKRRQKSNSVDRVSWIGSDSSGARVSVVLQQTFSASNGASSSSFYSISGMRCPDIVLQKSDESGGSSFLVFDAKYRTKRNNVLEAMATAHIYRDALRQDGEHADGALLLVPRGSGAPWLEAEEFQHEEKVGIIPFAPGSEEKVLEYLRNWLEDLLP